MLLLVCGVLFHREYTHIYLAYDVSQCAYGECVGNFLCVSIVHNPDIIDFLITLHASTRIKLQSSMILVEVTLGQIKLQKKYIRKREKWQRFEVATASGSARRKGSDSKY